MAQYIPRKFEDLLNTPVSLTGAKHKVLRVATAENALEYYDLDYVDIRDYGAVSGENSATALNDAITASTSKSYRVYIPPGTWIADAPIYMASGVQLFGAGAASILKAKASLDTLMIAVGSGKDSCVLENFSIDGNMANQSSANARGIYANNVTNLLVRGLSITQCYSDGVFIVGGSSGVRVEGCYVYNTGSTSYTTARGLYSYQSSKVSFVGNRIIAAVGFGGTFQETTEAVAIGNLIEDSTNYDGFIIYNCSNVAMIGNTIKNCKDSGIVFELCNHFEASGNVIQTAGYVGLYFAGSSYGTVSNNVFKDNGQNNHATYRHDIILTRSSSTPSTHNIVSGNICHATAAIKALYGIQEEYTDCNSNIITSNQCIGQTTPISTLGAATLSANNIIA